MVENSKNCAMKIGIFLSTQFVPGAPLESEIDNLLFQVKTAQESGLSSIWIGQHTVTGPLQMFQMLPLLARIVPETNGMIIGSSVVLLAMQNPLQIAEEMATLDWLCKGRLIVGAGIGYRKEEFEAAGIEMNTRGARFEEALSLVKQSWQGNEITFKGKHFNFNRQMPSLRPKQTGGPPIWIAGEVKASICRAAQMGDAWIPLPVSNKYTLESQLELFRNERKISGQNPVKEQPLMREVYVGDKSKLEFHECVKSLKYKYDAYASWGLNESSTSSNDFNDDFNSFSKDRFIIGSVQDVTEEIKSYRDQLGIDHLICRVQWPGLGQEQVISSIKRLGESYELLK